MPNGRLIISDLPDEITLVADEMLGIYSFAIDADSSKAQEVILDQWLSDSGVIQFVPQTNWNGVLEGTPGIQINMSTTETAAPDGIANNLYGEIVHRCCHDPCCCFCH